MSKYIAIYEAAFPCDNVYKGDPRRKHIIAEMRGVVNAKTVVEAAHFIEQYYARNDEERKQMFIDVRKIRRLARSK